uniref:Uncharacterized protein n=1 Tax=Anguilla anguilla TaxID=7936 RepID=A0A0E9WLR1_ANGAN
MRCKHSLSHKAGDQRTVSGIKSLGVSSDRVPVKFILMTYSITWGYFGIMLLGGRKQLFALVNSIFPAFTDPT